MVRWGLVFVFFGPLWVLVAWALVGCLVVSSLLAAAGLAAWAW